VSFAQRQGLTDELACIASDLFGGGQRPAVRGDREDRFRQFDAVGRLLREVTRIEPLLIILDDAHWADRASVLLVRHLARTLRDERLLVMVTLRSTENGHPVEVAELVAERHAVLIDLAGLSVGAVAVQLAALVGRRVDMVEAGRVHALTGGNPFFVAEVGRILPAWRIGGVAPTVSSTVRGSRRRAPVPAVAEVCRAASRRGDRWW
jgi:predicted ATPase